MATERMVVGQELGTTHVRFRVGVFPLS